MKRLTRVERAARAPRLPTFDATDRENILSVLAHDATKHVEEAKCRFLTREITQSELDWHVKHGTYMRRLIGRLDTVLRTHAPKTRAKAALGVKV